MERHIAPHRTVGGQQKQTGGFPRLHKREMDDKSADRDRGGVRPTLKMNLLTYYG